MALWTQNTPLLLWVKQSFFGSEVCQAKHDKIWSIPSSDKKVKLWVQRPILVACKILISLTEESKQNYPVISRPRWISVLNILCSWICRYINHHHNHHHHHHHHKKKDSTDLVLVMKIFYSTVLLIYAVYVFSVTLTHQWFNVLFKL